LKKLKKELGMPLGEGLVREMCPSNPNKGFQIVTPTLFIGGRI
jgi:hypothetical protein